MLGMDRKLGSDYTDQQNKAVFLVIATAVL